MKKLFDLLGLKVLTAKDGKILGNICDILVKFDSLLKIEGFIINSPDDKKHLFISWDDLRIGNDFALASMRKVPREFEKKNIPSNCLLKDSLIDLRVYSNDGQELGLVKDLFISEIECLIDGIACSDGLINDLFNGRTMYPLIGKVQLNDDSIYVSKECIDEAICRREMEV